MEQRDIEIFLTLADELHFGRAAERLHVSTARVSQTIKKLERRIGAPLFERTSRRVELTSIGRRLDNELRPAYKQLQDAIDGAVAAGRGFGGTLRVGFIGAASGRFVLEVAEVFRVEYPDCEVSLRENQFGEGLDPLRGGEVDMVLVTVPARVARQADLTAGKVLVEEDQLLAVSARHPFARRQSVSFTDLAQTTILRTPSRISDYWEMLALVGADAGTYPVSTQVTSHYVRPDVAYVPIHDAPPYGRRSLWLSATETARIRAFDRVAATRAAARTTSGAGRDA